MKLFLFLFAFFVAIFGLFLFTKNKINTDYTLKKSFENRKYKIKVIINIQSKSKNDEYYFKVTQNYGSKLLYQLTSKSCYKNTLCFNNIKLLDNGFLKTKLNILKEKSLILEYNTNDIKIEKSTKLSGMKFNFFTIRSKCLIKKCQKMEMGGPSIEFFPEQDFASSKAQKTQITAKFDLEQDITSSGEEFTFVAISKMVGFGNF